LSYTRAAGSGERGRDERITRLVASWLGSVRRVSRVSARPGGGSP